ncbi:MAG: hypothetical protein ACYDD1_08435 [Caulobacteraceae bacterium]
MAALLGDDLQAVRNALDAQKRNLKTFANSRLVPPGMDLEDFGRSTLMPAGDNYSQAFVGEGDPKTIRDNPNIYSSVFLHAKLKSLEQIIRADCHLGANGAAGYGNFRPVFALSPHNGLLPLEGGTTALIHTIAAGPSLASASVRASCTIGSGEADLP